MHALVPLTLPPPPFIIPPFQDACDTAGANLAKAVRKSSRDQAEIVTAAKMVELAEGLIQAETVTGHVLLHVFHPEMVEAEESKPLDLDGGVRDVLAKEFPGDGGMVVYRMYGVGKGVYYSEEQLESFCKVTSEHTLENRVLKTVMGRGIVTKKGREKKEKRRGEKRRAATAVDDVVEKSLELMAANSLEDSTVTLEDGKTIMLGLTHSWRREVAPIPATWSEPVEGVGVLPIDLIATGLYGRKESWVEMEGRGGFMRRVSPLCERQGGAVRDRKKAALTGDQQERREAFMLKFLKLELTEVSIKKVHLRANYKWLEKHSENVLGFGLGLTEAQMRAWVEKKRQRGEGADRNPKKKREAAKAAAAKVAKEAAAAAAGAVGGAVGGTGGGEGVETAK